MPSKKVLSPHCTQHVIPHLSTIPKTSPDDHNLMKPSPGSNPTVQDDESDSEINEEEYDNGADFNSTSDSSNDYGPDLSYKPDLWIWVALVITI